MFNGDIRAVIPQLAMSGGTMIACSCKEIIMGKQSSLGPVDSQFGNMPAQGLLSEFERARKEIDKNPNAIHLWQPIISHYPPTIIDSCEKAIIWADEILEASLKRNMLKDEKDGIIKSVMDVFASHETTKAHNRHLSVDVCSNAGLNIIELEDDDILQDYVLSIHHSCMELFEKEPAYKIFCN